MYGGNQIHVDELNQICSKVSVKSHMCTFRFNTLEQFCHICGFSMTRKLLGNPLLHVQRPTQLSCPPSTAGRELLHPTPLPRIGCAKEGGEQQALTACVELCGLPAPQLPLCHCCDASPAMDLLQMESANGAAADGKCDQRKDVVVAIARRFAP